MPAKRKSSCSKDPIAIIGFEANDEETANRVYPASTIETQHSSFEFLRVCLWFPAKDKKGSVGVPPAFSKHPSDQDGRAPLCGHLTAAKVLILPRPLPDAMTRTMSPLIGQLIANCIQSRTLATLRDTLLPKLLSGAEAALEKEGRV